MRKNSVAILIAVFVSTIASGQIKIGVKTGLQYSHLASYNEFNIQSDWAMGFNAGAFADIKTLPFLHIQASVLYWSLAYRNSNIIAEDPQTRSLIGDISLQRISYMQVPVYALFRFGLKKANLKIGAGPYFAFKVSDKTKIEGGDTFRGTIVPQGTKSIKSNVNGWGLYSGVEFNRWLVALNFQQTYKGIYDNLGTNLPEWKMGNIGLSVGYFLIK